jgi:hypothetical protein
VKFLTDVECRDWILGTGNDRILDKDPSEVYPKRLIRGRLPTTLPKLYPFARDLESSLQPYDWLLIWVRTWGVWPSSEPWHLYYKLRQSYSNFELLENVPGHLFRSHEEHDARGFLQLGLIAGWDMLLVPNPGYGYAFVSHDEFWEAGFDGDPAFEEAKDLLDHFA